MATTSEMTATAVIELIRVCESASIPVWLDGGCGVDTLLQTQTRPHKDVDIVLGEQGPFSPRNYVFSDLVHSEGAHLPRHTMSTVGTRRSPPR
jgi:hypothetical protein